MTQIRNICILGGGTAGWMTAAALSNKYKALDIKITLIESDSIGTVGVGEASLPHIRFFNQTLGIDEAKFMKATNATFKLGIEFCDWGKRGDSYIHPFGDYGIPMLDLDFHQLWLRLRNVHNLPRLDEYSYPILAAEQGKFRHPGKDTQQIGSNFGYAYQFDSSLYAKFLRGYGESRGVRRMEGRVIETELDQITGSVRSVELESGQKISAELFVDCSGFRGVLIEQALETGYDDWSHWLPCNRAFAVPSASTEELPPYTRATAGTAGWRWRIPLQHRVGNGHVYCSEFISDEEAVDQLLNGLEGEALAEPKQLFFKTGRRRKFWHKNVVAIGLSAGFLEPLESTSIHLIQEGITALIELFPEQQISAVDRDEYNAHMTLNFDRVRDFLVLHYVATQRDDSEMWTYFRNLELPGSLQEKLDAWLSRGYVLPYEFGVFLPPSWIAVMLGQNLIPRGFDRRAEKFSSELLLSRLDQVRQQTQSAVQSTPSQSAYLASFLTHSTPALV